MCIRDRAYTGGVDYAGPIRDHTAEANYLLDPTDSFLAVPLSVVVAASPPPVPVTRRSMSDSVIYELHVKGYTQLHPQVPEHLRGTYTGLAHPSVIEHLLATGVTAVELLPIHHFVSEPFVVGSGLANYWGYNSMGFFAPHEAYGSIRAPGRQVSDFKEMVSALHEAGIEVILDVVYNHTGEGGHEGPTLSFRGIDHGGYYRLTPDNRNDYDATGTGNSVDTSEPGVQRLVLDSMRYWVNEMGVDGFRFDLATTLIRDANHHVDQQHLVDVVVRVADERRGEVETEPVHAHLVDPVAHRVEHQPLDPGLAGVDGVARTGDVVVVAVVGRQPVVPAVVDAPEAQRRAFVTALAGVVVDDVEDHLDPGLVER